MNPQLVKEIESFWIYLFLINVNGKREIFVSDYEGTLLRTHTG